MIQEYPKMVYKSRKDYMMANNLEHEEKLAEDGYGSAEIVLLGRKPAGVKAAVVEKPAEPKVTAEPKPKRKRRTPAQMAEARKQK